MVSATNGVWESKASGVGVEVTTRGSRALTNGSPFPPSRSATTYRRAPGFRAQIWLVVVLTLWVIRYENEVGTAPTARAASAGRLRLSSARPLMTRARLATLAPLVPSMYLRALSAEATARLKALSTVTGIPKVTVPSAAVSLNGIPLQ